MSKFYVSGVSTHTCTVQLFTTDTNNYLGQVTVSGAVGSGGYFDYEVIFELPTIENVDIWTKRLDGTSTSYINVIPLDGSAKTVNVSYEYTEVYGGEASTY